MKKKRVAEIRYSFPSPKGEGFLCIQFLILEMLIANKN